MAITFTKTHYLARIHRFDADPITLCEEMLSCSIARLLENPAHSFTISLAGYNNLGELYRDNEIKADDWIEIFHAIGPNDSGISKEEKEGIKVILKDGAEIYVRCRRRFLGRIERFRRIESNDGNTTVRFSLSGSSWAKTIVQQPSVVLPYFEGGILISKFIKSNYKITDTPDENIRKLLDHFWANEQYNIPKSLQEVFGVLSRFSRKYNEKIGNHHSGSLSSTPTIYDITQIELAPCDGEVSDSQMLTANTQMFQLLQQYKNPLLNEFWCDLDLRGNPRITMRELPYCEGTSTNNELPSGINTKYRQFFGDLEPVVVDGDKWKDLDVGRSSHERYNWFVCTSEASLMGTIVSQQAELYKKGILKLGADSIGRYGLLRFEQGTMYSSHISGESKSYATLQNFTALCEHWYKKNTEYLSGSVQLKNVFDLMLGKKLIVADIKTNTEGIERHAEAFYVTGVTESWQAYSSANFEVTLVRGKPISDTDLNAERQKYNLINKSRSNPISLLPIGGFLA